ncbi:MAG: DUF11 domain-containing protein [Candidatus Nomurabacteria bacterium]|nr:MAG: DUF11 domain-containing protein [Candidatus Nomurabacteria bacterium]HRV76106.1 DUF11 domain-containing protein [Candidatus Saccharimonadales bacterium]
MSEKKSTKKKTNVVSAAFKKTVSFFKKKPLLFLALLAIAGSSVTLIGASAASGDCSDNSIVKCGGFSNGSGPSQANFNRNVATYHNAGNVDKIFDHYGIDDTRLGSLPLGTVNSDGKVYLNGKVVATGARSTGRQWVSGSTAIKIPGYADIYERDVSRIFRQGSIQAWIKLDANGRFMYAVLTVCGNPVVGTPVEPPRPRPTGTALCTALRVDKLDRTRFKFGVSASVTGSARQYGYIISYGDGNNGSVVNSANKVTFSHSYAQPGTYKIQAASVAMLDGKKIYGAGPTCAATVTVEKPPEEPKTPDFKIIKYVDGKDANDNASAVSVKANQEFEYKVVVTNTGETKLTNVKVWDVLPTGVTYVDNTLKQDGTLVTNDSDFFNASKGVIIKSIDLGKSVTFTMKAVVKANESEVEKKCAKEGTYYNNVAKADPEGTLPEKTDPAVVKCKEIPKVNKPGVDIEKDVSKSEVQVGEEFTWFLAVTNTGNVDLKNVKVTDPAPANIDFISAPAVTGTKITVGARNFEAVIENLKVGQVVNFEIKAKVTAQVTGQIVNTACVDAPDVKDQGDNPEVDDCDDAEVKVPPVPEKCPIPGFEDLDKDSDLCKVVPPVTPETPKGIPSTGGGELILMSVVALAIGSGVYAYILRGTKRA